MNLTNNPQLLDQLAGAYAMGTLRGGARRRFEAIARERPSVRVAVLAWQTRLAALNELQPAMTPDPAVWRRIAIQLEAEQALRASQQAPAVSAATVQRGPWAWLRMPGFWPGAAVAGMLATLLLVIGGMQLRTQHGAEIASLQAQLLAAPHIEYVAVLADDKSAASVLVTFDTRSRQLTLQRVGGFREASDKSLQLWALGSTGGVRSLGVLGSERVLTLAAAESELRAVPTLAISLEPKGGVPGAGGPTGPVLFKGALIQKQP